MNWLESAATPKKKPRDIPELDAATRTLLWEVAHKKVRERQTSVQSDALGILFAVIVAGGAIIAAKVLVPHLLRIPDAFR